MLQLLPAMGKKLAINRGSFGTSRIPDQPLQDAWGHASTSSTSASSASASSSSTSPIATSASSSPTTSTNLGQGEKESAAHSSLSQETEVSRASRTRTPTRPQTTTDLFSHSDNNLGSGPTSLRQPGLVLLDGRSRRTHWTRKWGRPFYWISFFILLMSHIQTSNGLPPFNDGTSYELRDAQPFTYERNFDLAQQKVIFNPVGQYATDVTFMHLELKVSFGHYKQMFQEYNEDARKAYDMAQQVGRLDKTIKKSIVSGLSALTFPVNMASQKFAEALLKLPEVSLQEARSDPNGRYRRDAVEEEPQDLNRSRRFVETIVAVGASVISWVSEIFKYAEIQAIKTH